jgi:hypothetical protein
MLVSVKRDRDSERTRTRTTNTDWRESIERNEAYESFSATWINKLRARVSAQKLPARRHALTRGCTR